MDEEYSQLGETSQVIITSSYELAKWPDQLMIPALCVDVRLLADGVSTSLSIPAEK
jgi:hypothetical protein